MNINETPHTRTHDTQARGSIGKKSHSVVLVNYMMTDLCYGVDRMEKISPVSHPNPHDPYQVSCYISNYLRANISKGHKNNTIV